MSVSRAHTLFTQHLTPAMWQTGLLFAVDMVTNTVDYAFHLYLGWALAPGDFASVQTINAVLLIIITAFSVMQPVVARFVAANAVDTSEMALVSLPALFQGYFGQSGWLALLLLVLAWFLRSSLAVWLNVPVNLVTVAAFMLVLALLRPVVAGALQGQQRFFAFGATRTAFALGRLGLALALISGLGLGALGGVMAMPMAATISLVVGLSLLGRGIWRQGERIPRQMVWTGWRLATAALLAYTAYMGLLNLDLIAVNRQFAPVEAGGYATAVVLRRIMAVLPGAVLVVLYPRVVALVSQRASLDRILLKVAVVIGAANFLLTFLFFSVGEWIVPLMFGQGYAAAVPLLGWMGVAMIGYGFVAIWLNLYLATRPPWPFVVILIMVLSMQLLILALWPQSLLQVTAVFASSGWLVAVAGFCLYWWWLRPAMVHRGED